jgi:site-specific recombinase XerD
VAPASGEDTASPPSCSYSYSCSGPTGSEIRQGMDGILRAKRPERLPVVLTRAEVRRLPDEVKDAATGERRRHHVHETIVQRAVGSAARATGVTKPVTPHALRHSFATDLLEDRYDIPAIQELLGHQEVATTMIYNRGPCGLCSPLDER